MRPRKTTGKSCKLLVKETFKHRCQYQPSALLVQVVIPEDYSYEVEYQALKEHLFLKYRQDIPAEFTKV